MNNVVENVGSAVTGVGRVSKNVVTGAASGAFGVGKGAVNLTGKAAMGVGKGAVNLTGKAVNLTTNVGKTVVMGTATGALEVGKGAVNLTGKAVNLTATTTLGVAGAATGLAVGVVGGVATSAVGAVGATAATMRTIARKGKYGGQNRRLKRQNSRLAWDSRVTAQHIKLDLLMECQRLPKKNSFSNADAFCAIWEIPAGHRLDQKVSKLPARHEKELGRTEVVKESRNPKFTTSFRLEYKFQEEQHYVVRVYNEDLQYSTDLREHDFIGGCYFTLGELMGAGGCSLARGLSQKSFLILIGREIIETREVLEFRFSGQDLGLLERKNQQRKNMQKIAKEMAKEVLDTVQKVNIANVLDKFDLYFRFEKLNKEDQTWKTVWKSEVIKDTQNPTWDGARIPLQLICDDDPETTVRITIWGYHRFSPDIMVGFVETTVNDVVQKSLRGIPVYSVMMERKRLLGGIKLKKAGVLKVLKANILQIPSMLQYISGGCRMDLMFAIDCTKINEDWRNENSQHFHSSTWLNDYQVRFNFVTFVTYLVPSTKAAIHKIATVYGAFEGEKDYAMWGYGAKINGQQTHAPFLMGENLKNADALIEAYDRQFSDDNPEFDLGETGYLKPVIQAAAFRAIQSNQKAQCYSTLVILSTGEVSDVTETIDMICAAAEDAPLSIIIIGVGSADMQIMDLLTGQGEESGKLRHSNGVPITREVVNFVTFQECNGNASQCVVEALKDLVSSSVVVFLDFKLTDYL